MHIGLIGGLGPGATVAYYTCLVAAFGKARIPLELTIVHADVSVLAKNVGADLKDAQAEVFAHHLRQLKGAGCDVATITALTGHFCFEETERLSPLPLISAIEPVDRWCEAQNIRTIGLLGSPAVLSTHLFGRLKSVKTVIPQSDPDKQGAAYMAMATTGVVSPESSRMFIDAGAEMVADQGADVVLLAGTDLGLVFDDITTGYPVVDALSLHVDALTTLAGQR